MKLVSFVRDGQVRWGTVDHVVTGPDDGALVDLGGLDPRLPDTLVGLLSLGADGVRLAEQVAAEAPTERRLRLGDVRLRAPVPSPKKIICIGLNYRDHAEESGAAVPAEPVVFAKLSNTVNGPYDPVPLPRGSQQVDYEGELGVVIGRPCRHVRERDALDYVGGYCPVNDVSARDVQLRNGQWVLGKSPDGFAPMGPALVTADEVGDPGDLDLIVSVDGEPRQRSNTDQMIFSVARIISFLSAYVTLEPGDVIATGTPAGVGSGHRPPRWLADGQTVVVDFPRLGRLANRFVVGHDTA